MLARLIAAAPLAALVSTAAIAGHQATTVYADARGNAQTSNGVNIGAMGDVWFRSGALVGNPSSFGVGGAVGQWNAGPFTPGATTVWATTLANADPMGRVDTIANASLDRGELKAVVDSHAIVPFGSSGFASARFQDAIWFTNTTGSWLPLNLSMAVDGFITGSGTRAEMFSYIGLSGTGGGCNSMAQCITPNLAAPFSGYSVALYGGINQMAAPGAKFGFREQLGGKTGDDIDWWNFSYGAGHDPDSGLYDYAKTITLWIPSGETTLVLDSWFNITVCAGTRRCDFGNTSAIRFGALPEGLSWTSQSGVFLSALGNGGGGVIPEPATWAMMIAGFGLVGAAARRRRGAALAAG